MSTNTAEVLNRGMECLLGGMTIVEAERFLFLVKTEGFDYTKWQREYFGKRDRADMEKDMKAYFSEKPYQVDPAIVL